MTASYPYSESRNYTFMYDLQDLRGPPAEITGCPNTVLGYLQTNREEFSGFLHIIKMAEMEDMFAQKQFQQTVFVPSDKYLNIQEVKKIDQDTAKNIINFSTMNRFINEELLTASPASYFVTRYKHLPQLLVTNISGITQLNGCANVTKFDISLSNGLIHLVDHLIVP